MPPGIQFVGEDLTPLAQTRDFTPCIAKIKASGPDSIITGNWGSDLTLLMQAANDAGLDVKLFTDYANMTREARELMDAFMKTFNDGWYTGAVYHACALLSSAMAQARSTEPAKVAVALEGLKIKSFNGEVEMRKTDRPLPQTQYTRCGARSAASPAITVSRTPATASSLSRPSSRTFPARQALAR